MKSFVLDPKLNPSLLSEVCTSCTHLDREHRLERRCKAFPRGIPEEIWDGKNDHRKPVRGDHGIQYEAIRAVEAA